MLNYQLINDTAGFTVPYYYGILKVEWTFYTKTLTAMHHRRNI